MFKKTFIFFWIFVLCLLTMGPVCVLAAQSNGTNKVFALSENLDVEPSSGTASISIPIEVPQGRAGIQPNVTLFYNSSGGNGPLGVGWSMELGYIQRSTKKGTPKYSNTDTFVLVQAGSSQELVDISGNGTEFRPETEGSFSKIKFDGTSWIITDRKGTKYYFGSGAVSRVADPSDATRVFKWHFDKAEDLNGNFMTVSYLPADNQLYPQEVQYTANSVLSLPAYASVKFFYETKTNAADTANSFMSGFQILQTQRLSTIEVRAEGNLARKYTLNYIQASVTGKSLLNSVTLFGADGVSTLPATKMTYSSPVYSMDAPVTLPNLRSINLGQNKMRFMDMNNDGLPDLLDASREGNWELYPNTSKDGTTSWGKGVVVPNSPVFVADNPYVRFVDISGDGLLDVVIGNAGGRYQIFINTGNNGFEPIKIVTNAPTQTIWSNNIQFMDMNSDGVADMVESFVPVSGNYPPYKIYMNDGTGNFNPPIIAVNSGPFTFPMPNLRFEDFNADGLVDMAYGDASTWRIWINNGVNGFYAPKSVTNFPAGLALSSPHVRIADLNGDGLADIVKAMAGSYTLYLNNGKNDFNPGIVMKNSPLVGTENITLNIIDFNGDHLQDVVIGSGPYRVSLNSGNSGFLPEIVFMNFPPVNMDNRDTVLLDFNGDGVLDFVWGTTSNYKIWTNAFNARQAKGNSLLDVDNSVGGHLELQYQNLPVKGWGGFQYGIANSRSLLNTVKTISRRATLTGDVYVSTYDYQGGLWDNKNREFRGFKTVKMIDPDGNYSMTEYAQDDIYKGRPLTQSSYDSAGHLFSKSVNTWANQVIYSGVNFPYLKQTDSYIYDGDATGRRTQAQFFYEESPQYGNLTKSINLGEVDLTTGADIGTDQSTTEVVYHNNTVNWLLGLPKTTTIKDNAGAQFAKTTFYYDSSADEGILPTKGFLTKKLDWAGDAVGTVHPFTAYTYDAIGNLLTTADSKNSTTSISYDAVYRMFPLETTNAIGHKVINEYYGINGVALSGADTTFGLWGQLKSTTDPNQKKGLRIYDTFGRTVKMVSPLDTIALPTSSYEYVYGAWQLKVLSRQRIQSGYSATMDSVSFYDGLGRLVQSKTKSEIPGKSIVSGQTQYNLRGLPVKKYVPYMSDISFLELAPIDSNQPHAAIVYDAMGRAIRTTAPDGSYSNGVYDDWNLTSFDENGHMQKSYMDAFGRLIKKEEYEGADGRNSVYPTSAYTLYATTLYTYDPKGNLVKTQDAKGNITTISYDTLGRKIQMTDPDMGTWKYGYDVEGNLIWQQDAKGQKISFTYDQINRLKSKTDLSVLTVNYTYDDINGQNTKGRLTKAAYPGGNTAFAYDAIGRETYSAKTIGYTNFTVSRSYDDLDRLMRLQYPQTGKIGYMYNQAGLVNSIFQVLSTTTMPPPTNGDNLYIASPFSEYRFNENTVTTSVVDSGTSKTNLTASVNTSTMTTSGKVGTAFKFNGVNSFINIDVLKNKIRYDNKGSFSMWVKPQDEGTFLSFGGVGGSVTMEWFEALESFTFTIIGVGTPISVTTPEHSVPYDTWTHVAVVQDGVNLKIYVNGQDVPLFYWSQTNKGAWFNYITGEFSSGRIGCFNETAGVNNNSKFLRGSIDDLRYYSNKALIPQEVWGLYNNGLGTELENPPMITTPPSGVSLIPRMPLPYAQYKLNDNGPSSYVFDDSAAFNDGVATQSTSAMSVPGKINSALSFNGIDQYVDMKSLWSDIKSDTAGSLSLWVKPQNGLTLWNSLGPGTAGYLFLAWESSTQSVLFSIFADGDIPVIQSSTPVGSMPANIYSHLVVSQSGTGLKIYINGVEQNISYRFNVKPGAWMSSVTGNITTTRLGASGVGSAVTGFFQGSIDDFRYYRKALSAHEIGVLYNGGLGTEESDPALSSAPTPLPTLEPSTVPASAGQVYIKNVDYNAAGQMTKVEYGNGVVTSYTYSAMTQRLTNLKTVNHLGSTLQDFTYTYDGVGNITAIADKVNSATQTFAYDALNRLTKATGLVYGTKNYTYDQIGNIISKDGFTYTYGTSRPHAVTAVSNGTTISYDLNGNMVTKSKPGEVFAYSYDKENRLTQVKKNSTLIAKYLYDGDGGRVQKTSYLVTTNTVSGGFGALTGNQQIVTTPVITRYVGELYEQTGSVGTAFIFLGSQRVAAVDTNNLTPLYYHTDHLGSTNVISDNNGSVSELIEYDPYGKISRHDGSLANVNRLAKQQFTGKQLDDETGLIYFGARYYDPSLGRFITPDTIVQNPSDPQTLNRYSYCSNNPINKIDPTGHKWSWGKFFKAAVGAIVGVTLGIISAGALTPALGVFWAGVAGGAIGGAVGGGLTTALNGGSWGQIGMSALMGAGFGALGGGFGASSLSNLTKGIIGGIALAAGAVYAAKTDNLDSFAGGLVGGYSAYASHTRITTGKWPWAKAEQAQVDSGVQETVGNSRNTPNKSLDSNLGKQAVSKQAVNVVKRDVPGFPESRPLVAEDLGIDPSNLTALNGSLSMNGNEMLVRINMIESTRQGVLSGNVKGVMPSLLNVAARNGATSMRVQAIYANEGLYYYVQRNYGPLTNEGFGVESFTMQIPRGDK